MLKYWPSDWIDQSDPNAPHRANLLGLQIDKSFTVLDILVGIMKPPFYVL